MRYSELSRSLAGVSQKMLTQTLRSLERDGLLTRTVTPTVPVTVSYALTDLGLSLQGMMRGLKAGPSAHGRGPGHRDDIRHPRHLTNVRQFPCSPSCRPRTDISSARRQKLRFGIHP